MRQVDGFLRFLLLHHQYNCPFVESGVKHHNPTLFPTNQVELIKMIFYVIAINVFNSIINVVISTIIAVRNFVGQYLYFLLGRFIAP